MKLKKFNTEALVKEAWLKVYGHTKYNGEVIYVNIYKDNRIEIACDLEQAKRLESLNDMRSRAELHHRFKGTKTEYDKYQKTEYDKEGWAAEQTEIGLIIYFYGKKMYHINEYKSDIDKYYILELIYEKEPEPEIPNSVLKDYLPHEKPNPIEVTNFLKKNNLDAQYQKDINELQRATNYLLEQVK